MYPYGLDDLTCEDIVMSEERIAETRALLAKHHRDGERFAAKMKESFASRFDAAFWGEWERWVTPIYSATPVVLDLGTGPGLFIKALTERTPGIRAIGVECAPYMLEAMEDLPAGAEIIVDDLHDPHLPLADGTVDAALASVVLHEMHQPLKTLYEMRRVLKPGGRFIIADWVRVPFEVYVREQGEAIRLFDPATDVARLEDTFIHFIEHNRFNLGDLIYLLNQTGFAVLHTTLGREGCFARIVAERRTA